jgi:hypothetical protein
MQTSFTRLKTDLFVYIELINKTLQLKIVTYFHTTIDHQKLDNIKRYNDKIRSIWNFYYLFKIKLKLLRKKK